MFLCVQRSVSTVAACLLIHASASLDGEDWTAPVAVRVTTGDLTAVIGANAKMGLSATPSQAPVSALMATRDGVVRSPVSTVTMARCASYPASVSMVPPATTRQESASVHRDTQGLSVESDAPPVVTGLSVNSAAPVRTEERVTTSPEIAPALLGGRVQFVPSPALLASTASTAARTVPVVMVDCVTTSRGNASAQLASVDADVKRTVPWAPMVRNVTRGVSVRMEPSVITSMEPACVKQGLKALIAKRDSVPPACTVSSVTSTAPVMPPTL